MNKPFDSRSMLIYAALQVGVLIFCWSWFAVLWYEAFFNFHMGDLEWWLLFGAALAGLYGLRPNLEKAIDKAWLGKLTNQNQFKERAAQLKPVKRRIDLIFSLVVIGILMISLGLWLIGTMQQAPASFVRWPLAG